MFDLEERLEQWRQRFTSMEALRGSDIEELEQHLRDSMAALTSNGLDAEEAFIIATRRVGAPGSVEREFAKVNGSHIWSQRVFWMAAGVLGYVVCGFAIAAIASLSQIFVVFTGGKGASVGFTAVAITCLGWMVVAAALYRRWNKPSPDRLLTRRSAGVIGSWVVLAAAVAFAMKVGMQVVFARLLPLSELGQAMMISAAANAMLPVLMPLALLIVMLTLQRRMRETPAVDL
jgi:hypothetical protein